MGICVRCGNQRDPASRSTQLGPQGVPQMTGGIGVGGAITSQNTTIGTIYRPALPINAI